MGILGSVLSVLMHGLESVRMYTGFIFLYLKYQVQNTVYKIRSKGSRNILPK